MTVGNLTDEDVERLVRAGRYCVIEGKPCLVVPKPIKWEDYMRKEKLENYLNTHCFLELTK